MATTLINPTTDAASQTFTVAEGQIKGIFLVPATGQQLHPDAEGSIEYMSGSDPVPVGLVRKEGVAISVSGSYRVSKLAGANFGFKSEP